MEMMRIDNVCKSFGGKTLLDDVCISVQNNQITGLFGNDGAGKTVLIDIITGRCPSDGGDVGFFSEKGWIDYNSAAHDIALVREELVTDTYFTIGMYIDIVKKIYPDIDMDLLYDVLSRFNLDVRNRIMFLMNDMQVELQIAIAVARRPKLMILDEPFTGLFQKTTESVKSLLSQYVGECEGSVLVTASLKDDIEGLCDSLYELHDGNCSCIVSKDSKGQSVITEFPVSRSMRVFQEKRAVIFGGGMAFVSFLNAIIVPHSSSIMFAVSAFGLVFYLCCTLFISGSDLAMMDFGHSRQSIVKTMRKTLLVCFAAGFLCALVCYLSDPIHTLSLLIPFTVAMPLSVLMLRTIIDKRIPFGLYANIVTFILMTTIVLGLCIFGDNLVLPTVLNDPMIVSATYAVSVVLTLMMIVVTEKDYIHRYLTIERPPVKTPRQWRQK